MDPTTLKVSPTQRRMLDILKDGAIHSKAELGACMADELQDVNNVRWWVNTMRGTLQPLGFDIIWQGKEGYRLVAHVKPNLNGTHKSD